MVMKRLDTSTVENFAKKEDNLKCDIKLKVESNCDFFAMPNVDLENISIWNRVTEWDSQQANNKQERATLSSIQVHH